MNRSSRDRSTDTCAAPLASEQAGPQHGGAEWCVLRDESFFGPPRYRVVRHVKTVKSRAYFLDRWDDERYVNAKSLAVTGLSETAATYAREQLTSSQALWEQEFKASTARANDRAQKIIESALSRTPQVEGDKSRDDHPPPTPEQRGGTER